MHNGKLCCITKTLLNYKLNGVYIVMNIAGLRLDTESRTEMNSDEPSDWNQDAPDPITSIRYEPVATWSCCYILFKKRNAKPFKKKETQNHIQKKKRKTAYWWHWEDNFNCCMVGPQGLHFCKSDFGHLWPTAQNLDILWTTIQQLKLSSQCHQYVVLRFFFWNGFAFLFLKSIMMLYTVHSVQCVYSTLYVTCATNNYTVGLYSRAYHPPAKRQHVPW